MVFGLFSRKSSDGAGARLPTPTPSVSHPSPLRFSTVLPAESAPPPADDTRALHGRLLAIPPKTLHAYTLARLRPPRPPSPATTAKLAAFFSSLAPPPLLHCVRCHKDFYDIENEEKDRACRVPHDDESALVSRISGGGYETLWGCCGQTASGDGGEGPPDGWCYEGRHTTDFKRARFRADSTIHNDKLTSCLKLNCHGIRPPSLDNIASSSARRSNPSPTRSLASTTRKRPRESLKEASSSESEAAKERPKPRPKPKPQSRSVSRRETGSRATPPVSKPRHAAAMTPPKSTSRTHTTSDSEASTRSRPRTRSCVREESFKGDRSPRARNSDEEEDRGRKRRRLARGKD